MRTSAYTQTYKDECAQFLRLHSLVRVIKGRLFRVVVYFGYGSWSTWTSRFYQQITEANKRMPTASPVPRCTDSDRFEDVR